MHHPSSSAPPGSAGIHAHRGLAVLLASLSALGPFSIDAYLPSFLEIGHAFNVTPVVVQQTITAYMMPFAAMTLWQGALSDAFGRRRIVLSMLTVFAFASIGCMCAWNIGVLIGFRALQGLSAGAGLIIGRAIVRDLFDGADARRLMSRIAVVFAIAPALGPIIGGWLHVWFGWRSVFAFLAVFSGGLWYACWKALPETLPPEKRHPLHPRSLLKGYWQTLTSVRFIALVVSLTLNFSAVFIYVISAPVFMLQILHRGETEFYWLFGPITVGMIIGTSMAGKVAGHWSNLKTVRMAYAVMALAALANAVFHWAHPAVLPWSVVPLAIYVIGVTFAMPSLTLMALDLFPNRRGLAASCQGFVQTSVNTAIAAVLAPMLWASAARLAGGMLVIFAAGGTAFLVYLGLQWTAERRLVR